MKYTRHFTLAIISLFFMTDLFAQNRISPKNMRPTHLGWQLFQTEHFDVEHEQKVAEAARDAANLAERGYAHLSAIFEHGLDKRIPLVLFASLNDYQQADSIRQFGHNPSGVTDLAELRVALAVTGSNRELNQTLLHELVHAFQFDITHNAAIIGECDPPLWFFESLAEYLAVGMDSHTRMWIRDGVMHDHLLSMEKLGSTFDIRVYRQGAAFWHYIAEKYGKKKVGQLFKSAIAFGNLDKAFQAELGMDSVQLTAAWHQQMRDTYSVSDAPLQKASAIASRLTEKESFFHRVNAVPAISPNGHEITYLTDKNLADDIYILKEDGKNLFKSSRLIKGSQSSDFDALRFFDTTISWSHDGQKISYISMSGKDDALFVTDARDGTFLQRFVFKELDGLLSPSFSPDGNEIVFVGIAGGRSDLFIIDLQSGQLRRLTKDRFSNLQPQWSPDGKTIAFITDHTPNPDKNDVLPNDYNIALHHLQSGEVELLTALAGNVNSPQWSNDAAELAFVSDHQGVSNIYKLDMATGEIIPVTFLQSGVVGLSELTPAMSWSANGHYMVFSTFEDGAWQLYRLELPQDEQDYQVMNIDPAAFFSSQGSAALAIEMAAYY